MAIAVEVTSPGAHKLAPEELFCAWAWVAENTKKRAYPPLVGNARGTRLALIPVDVDKRQQNSCASGRSRPEGDAQSKNGEWPLSNRAGAPVMLIPFEAGPPAYDAGQDPWSIHAPA